MIARLLEELCVEVGLCLPPEARARLTAQPSVGVDAFIDAVLLTEGLNPQFVDKHLRQQVRDRVARHFLP